MQIITDTSSLYSPQEGRGMGITVIPACALVDGKVYRDYEDISCDTFLKLIEDGAIPTSSQPAIGEVLEIFEQSKEDILYLAIGDGLSGTYQNAMGARNLIEQNEHIHIIDTKTLAGCQRYLVQKAMKLREEGLNIEDIIRRVKESIETSVSFVIPFDFDFLKRSGRLTPIAAKIGGVIKIVPVLTQTEDMRRIRPFAIKRSRKKGVEAIMEHLKEMGVGKDHVISISHGGVSEVAKEVFEQMRSQFSDATMEILQLAPALITHGGPGCITIQAIHK